MELCIRNISISLRGSSEIKDVDGNKVSTTMEVIVLSPGDEGYVGTYSIPEINKFQLTGYKTIRAYYELNNEDMSLLL